MNKITYIADIDQDIDDFIAVLYLQKSELLKEVVFDPEPISSDGIQRKNVLIKKGVKISDNISEVTSVIFCGGALRNVLSYVKKHHIQIVRHEDGIDLTCPFRNNELGICTVYEKRPQICRDFRCDKPQKKIDDTKEKYEYDNRFYVVNLRLAFK